MLNSQMSKKKIKCIMWKGGKDGQSSGQITILLK